MKINLVSDCHVEFDRDNGDAFIQGLDPDIADVLVIAGDLGGNHRALHAIERIAKKYWPKQVLYVAGNHEYYGMVYDDFRAAMRVLERDNDNLSYLDEDVVTVEGQRFVGASLWYRDHGRYNWSDFRHIPGIHGWISRRAQEQERFFEERLQPGDVAVSHMLPSDRCVHPKWQGNRDNIFFLNDVTDIIEEKKPKLWLFGHTHESLDVMVGETRCVSNPRAYPFEDSGFDILKVLET